MSEICQRRRSSLRRVKEHSEPFTFTSVVSIGSLCGPIHLEWGELINRYEKVSFAIEINPSSFWQLSSLDLDWQLSILNFINSSIANNFVNWNQKVLSIDQLKMKWTQEKSCINCPDVWEEWGRRKIVDHSQWWTIGDHSQLSSQACVWLVISWMVEVN